MKSIPFEPDKLPATQQAIPTRAVTFSRHGIVIFLGICLAWVIWNTAFAFPAVDDFCYGLRARRDGIFGAVVSEYLTWGGRYSSTLLLAAFASSKSNLLHAYFIVPIAVLSANLIAACYFLRKLGINSRRYQFVFFVAVIALFSFRESVFWMAGAFTYGIGCALFLVLIAEESGFFLDVLNKRQSRLSWPKTAALSAASFVLAGFNETIMVAHAVLLIQLFLFSLLARQKDRVIYQVGIILLFAMIGAFIVNHAPGNLAREAPLATPDLLRSIGKSFWWIFERYTHVFLTCWLLFYSSLIVFDPVQGKTIEKPEFKLIAVVLFITLWAALFTRAYALNGSGPSRTHSVDLLLVSLLAFHAARYVYSANKEAVLHSRRMMPIFMSFVGIFITAITLRANADGLSLNDTLAGLKYGRPLKQQMEARFTLAEQAAGKSLQFADFPDKTRSITYFDDIRPDSKDWRNTCFAGYFDLIDVKLKN
jgi:hypothetical protein